MGFEEETEETRRLRDEEEMQKARKRIEEARKREEDRWKKQNDDWFWNQPSTYLPNCS